MKKIIFNPAPPCQYGEYLECRCTPTCADIRMDQACAQWVPNADAAGKTI